MPSHLPPDTRTTKAGPSRSSGFRRLHRYGEPLGLPLDTARFHVPLIPAAFARRGPSSRASLVPNQTVPACPLPYPGSVLHLSGTAGAVCCLRRGMTGSAGSTLSGSYLTRLQSSRFRIGPAVSPPSPRALRPVAGPLTLRLDSAISDVARSLLRGAPALTATGLPPASLIQHRYRAVQARFRSRRGIGRSFYPFPGIEPRVRRARPPFKPCVRISRTRLSGGLSGRSITRPPVARRAAPDSGRSRAGGGDRGYGSSHWSSVRPLRRGAGAPCA